MNWVTHNAAGIQAIAAIASLAVTVVLARLTGNYVRLTRAIADASAEQIRFMKETSEIRRRQLAATVRELSKRVRLPLAGLPKSPAHSSLRTYAHLTNGDIAEIEGLSRELSASAISYASKAAYSLRVMLAAIEKMRGVEEIVGWVPTNEEARAWADAVEAAPRMLAELEREAQSIVDRSPEPGSLIVG